jgi:PAS domain S-box-containing protein
VRDGVLGGRALCLGGAALGALGLAGWISGPTLLTTLGTGRPPMMPNTALALILAGGAGAIRHRDAGRLQRALACVAALIVLAIAVGTLAEYVLPVDLPIDQLFIRTEAGPYPGRPSPPTALALSCLALAILLSGRRPIARARPSEWLVLFAGLVGLTSLLGQLFGADALYRLARVPVIGVALHTALALLLISVGLLLERPDAGIMRVVTARGPGGVLLRRLMPAAIAAPAVLGLAVMHSVDVLGFEQLPVVLAALAAVMGVAGLVLLIVTAVPLNRSHEALEHMRQRTHDLVEQAPDGIFVADLHGRYTDVNGAGCRMLGYAREDIVGTSITDLLPREDVERLWRSKEELLAGGIHVGEWRLRRKDGTYLPVEVSAKILADGRWQGFVRDISERKRLEEALRLSEAKSSGILSISADAVISIDETQRITMFNEGAEKIFGYSKAEAIGSPLEILIPERFRARHRLLVERFAAAREVARRISERGTTIVGLRKNGEEFPADAAISKLDVGGTSILTVTLRDVTEQKRREREQKLLAEMGSVPTATLDDAEMLGHVARMAVRDFADLCVVDVVDDDGAVRRLQAVGRDPSRAWACDLLMKVPVDRTRPDLMGSVRETGHPALLRDLSPERVASLAETEDERRALRALDPRSALVVPLAAGGKLLGVMGFVSSSPSRAYGPADLRFAREIAQRAALSLENTRLHRAAHRAIRARDDVLGIVAHDLRNPLNAIRMQARLLLRNAGEAGPRSREPAAAIDHAVTRMNRLIQDLLDVTHLEAGGLSIECESLPAAQVIVDAVDAHRPLAASASLDLRLDVAPALPRVWADGERLLQVFENLIDNAIKFTNPGGQVVVGAAPRNGEVVFRVADTGAGIAPEALPHLFDRFWQMRKARHAGAGLGLPIVKGIVEAHGGRVWVESTPGRGSSFFFTIPAAPPAGQTEIAAEAV